MNKFSPENCGSRRRASRIFLTASILLSLSLSWLMAEEPNPNLAAIAAPRDPWMDQHNRLVELAKQGGIDVFFLGDALTEGWTKPARGLPVWDAKLKPLKSANFGIQDDNLQNVLWRLQNGEIDGVNPKAVVLLVGAANIIQNETSPQVVAGVTAVVREIQKRSPQSKILLLGIFPVGATAEDPSRLKQVEVNTQLAKLADGKRVIFLDLSPQFLKPDGTVAEVNPDFMHLSQRGYQMWGAAIESPLQQLLSHE